jgi:hypothetical protein
MAPTGCGFYGPQRVQTDALHVSRRRMADVFTPSPIFQADS